MFALNMMRIALELALYNNVYEEMAMKFFEHFLSIAHSLDNMGMKNSASGMMKMSSFMMLLPPVTVLICT